MALRPYLRFPGGDARLYLTDLYVFPAAGDVRRTVVIIDVNPFTTGLSATPPFLISREFHPDAVYRISIDNNGDSQADAAISFCSSRPRTVCGPVQAGPRRLFVGVRSDPFFADAEGAPHGFVWTGEDAFAGKDVQCIALEVPDEMLGTEPTMDLRWSGTATSPQRRPPQSCQTSCARPQPASRLPQRTRSHR